MRHRCYGAHPHAIPFPTNAEPLDHGIRVYSASRNASHPINAILNYAYGVLQSQVQIKVVSEGHHGMLGIMHYGRALRRLCST